jgi:hypothetical protein
MYATRETVWAQISKAQEDAARSAMSFGFFRQPVVRSGGAAVTQHVRMYVFETCALGNSRDGSPDLFCAESPLSSLALRTIQIGYRHNNSNSRCAHSFHSAISTKKRKGSTISGGLELVANGMNFRGSNTYEKAGFSLHSSPNDNRTASRLLQLSNDREELQSSNSREQFQLSNRC